MSILLERNIVVNDLPSEANLLHSLDSVLWYIVRWCFRTLLIFIVCLSHVAAPLSQSRIVQITPWNIEVSKFLFELKEFIVQSSKMLTAHDFLASLPSISSTRTHYTNLPYFRQTLALTFLFFFRCQLSRGQGNRLTMFPLHVLIHYLATYLQQLRHPVHLWGILFISDYRFTITGFFVF